MLEEIVEPYLVVTNALKPKWTRWLVHASLIVGCILIPLIFVLICFLACKKKKNDEPKEDIADGYPKTEEQYEI